MCAVMPEDKIDPKVTLRVQGQDDRVLLQGLRSGVQEGPGKVHEELEVSVAIERSSTTEPSPRIAIRGLFSFRIQSDGHDDGDRMHDKSQEAALSVEGMTLRQLRLACAEGGTANPPACSRCDVNLARGRAVVRFDPEQTDPQQIADADQRCGVSSSHAEHAGVRDRVAEQQRLDHQHARTPESWKWRAIVGIAPVVPGRS